MGLSRAAPRDAPTCCVVFNVALATPESSSRILVSAVLLRAGKARPSPRLMTICCGNRWVQYDVCTPIWVSHNRPNADVNMPADIATRGPTLGSKDVEAPAATITPSANGRKATPAFAAE